MVNDGSYLSPEGQLMGLRICDALRSLSDEPSSCMAKALCLRRVQNFELTAPMTGICKDCKAERWSHGIVAPPLKLCQPFLQAMLDPRLGLSER